MKRVVTYPGRIRMYWYEIIMVVSIRQKLKVDFSNFLSNIGYLIITLLLHLKWTMQLGLCIELHNAGQKKENQEKDDNHTSEHTAVKTSIIINSMTMPIINT